MGIRAVARYQLWASIHWSKTLAEWRLLCQSQPKSSNKAKSISHGVIIKKNHNRLILVDRWTRFFIFIFFYWCFDFALWKVNVNFSSSLLHRIFSLSVQIIFDITTVDFYSGHVFNTDERWGCWSSTPKWIFQHCRWWTNGIDNDVFNILLLVN